jgi:hypothetical protein
MVSTIVGRIKWEAGVQPPQTRETQFLSDHGKHRSPFLAGIVGRVGVTEATDLIREKVFLAIANLYPEFADECQRQSKSRRTLVDQK